MKINTPDNTALPSAKKGYRPDIDGLRAIAVVAVILYHFHIPPFQGGFVGVDIFFVISGYLITKNIASQIEKRKFSFSEFYSRRTRRLIPTLLFVIMASFICGALLLSPADMASFSGSVVYAVAGISNFYFWMQSGYFDNFSSLKPLLHTWSLSVELQFYLIWPILLLLLCRVDRLKSIRFLLILLFVLISCYLSASYSYAHSETAFFMTPFRMHEFAIGGAISFLNIDKINKAIISLLYMAGLAVVIGSILLINVSDFVFPGYIAIVPCTGAALMILSGNSHPFSFITGNRIFSHIGEISYSLYLVHWPVFVFGSYAIVLEPTVTQTVIMLMVTILASYVSYYCVEKPFRNPQQSRLTNSGFNAVCVVVALAIAIPAISSWKYGGWEWRIPEDVRNVNNISDNETKSYTWKEQRILDSRIHFSDSGKEKLLIIGDSQSADFINALYESGSIDNYDVVARTVLMECGAPYLKMDINKFLSDVNKQTSNKTALASDCKRQISRAMDRDLIEKADKIVISMYYNPQMIEYIKQSVSEIKNITNAKIYLIGRKNLVKSSIEIVNSFQRLVGVEKYAAKLQDGVAISINKKLSDIKDAKFIDMLSIVCPSNNECKVLDEKNRPLFFDKAHFTKYGAIYFGAKVSDIIS
ncbi:TPA: acyltransferase [Enterobacter cloacae]|nr:acyltransferase [Enterobacter cloacae]